MLETIDIPSTLNWKKHFCTKTSVLAFHTLNNNIHFIRQRD